MKKDKYIKGDKVVLRDGTLTEVKYGDKGDTVITIDIGTGVLLWANGFYYNMSFDMNHPHDIVRLQNWKDKVKTWFL